MDFLCETEREEDVDVAKRCEGEDETRLTSPCV